jgi:tetratricopeptide (TPR) repeat protein
MQFRRGFLITSTILIIILIIPITWLLWKFVCKPVYRHFTDKQTPVEQAVNNKSRDTKKEVKYDGKAEKSDKQTEESEESIMSNFSSKFKNSVGYTKNLFTHEEEEKEADMKIDNCNDMLNKKDYENALIACDEALEKTSVNGKISVIHQLRGRIYQNTGEYDSSRKEFIIAEQSADTAQQKNQSKKMFAEADNLFKKSFLEKEYDSRKLLVPVERKEEILPTHYTSAFLINSLPDKITMPLGHLVPNQLYILHPYKENKYVLFDDYEMDFLAERVREFCEFAQALGATDVVIESIQSKSSEKSSSSKEKRKGKINLAGIVPGLGKGSFDSNDENTRYLLDTALQGISISQKFTPSQKPFLPDNLVWYEHEPSWQQLYRQRMMGNLLEHREHIESKKNRMVQSSEISKIEGELQAVMKLAGGDWDKSSSKKLSAKDDTELTIYVKFAPLNNTENRDLSLVVPTDLQ